MSETAIGRTRDCLPDFGEIEPYLTIREAAQALGLQGWKLQRAVKSGAVPSYKLLNSRRLVRLSEVIAAIEASREGGDRG